MVGANIRDQRKAQDLTQMELANRADMHSIEIGRAERGERDLRISTLVKIARGLSVAPADLLKHVE